MRLGQVIHLIKEGKIGRGTKLRMDSRGGSPYPALSRAIEEFFRETREPETIALPAPASSPARTINRPWPVAGTLTKDTVTFCILMRRIPQGMAKKGVLKRLPGTDGVEEGQGALALANSAYTSSSFSNNFKRCLRESDQSDKPVCLLSIDRRPVPFAFLKVNLCLKKIIVIFLVFLGASSVKLFRVQLRVF